MGFRGFHNKRTIDVDVEVDLYDHLGDWDQDDFQEYFEYSNRDFNCNDNPAQLVENGNELNYDEFEWELVRGNIDKNKILAILERLK